MEMNTRLQVEHPVTEAITGIDLVEWQLRVAQGERFTRQQADIRFSGHAIEARLCAEDPARDFLPQPGRIALWRARPRRAHRSRAGNRSGDFPYYDSMIAKVIAHGRTRDEARERLARALDQTVVLGLPTNKAFLAGRAARRANSPRAAPPRIFSAAASRRSQPVEPDAASLAIAAALRAAKRGFGEWNSWSNNPARVMRAKFGQTEVALSHLDDVYRAEIGDAVVTLRLLSIDPPHARVALDGADETVTFLIEHDTIHLARSGQSFRLENAVHAAGEPRRRRI